MGESLAGVQSQRTGGHRRSVGVLNFHPGGGACQRRSLKRFGGEPATCRRLAFRATIEQAEFGAEVKASGRPKNRFGLHDYFVACLAGCTYELNTRGRASQAIQSCDLSRISSIGQRTS
jgi:hypothetical protein